MSIAKRIALAAALLTLGIVFVTGMVSYRFTYFHILQDIQGALERDVSFSAQRLEQRLDSVANEVALLSKNLMIVNALIDSAGRDTYIVPFFKSYRLGEEIPFVMTLYDFEGKALASSAAQKPGPRRGKELFKRIFDHRQPYAKIAGRDDELRLLIAYPIIYGATKKPEGFLEIEVDIDELIRRILGSRDNFRSDIVISSGPDVIWSHQHVLTGDLLNASKALTLKDPIHLLGLKLELGESREALFGPLRELMIVYVETGAFVLALTILLSSLISRQLTKRITALNNTVSLVSEKGLSSVEIDDAGDDEIANLAANFKKMLGKIRESQENLEARVEERTLELSVSEKKYRDLVDNSLVGVYQTNLRGALLYANEAMVRLFGYGSPEELMSEGILRRYKNPKDRGAFLERLEKAGNLSGFEIEALTKTGEILNLLVTAHIENDMLSGMVMDVTERKQAEKALKESEHFLKTIIETEPECIKLLASDGSLLQMNRAGLSMIEADSFDQVKGQCVYPLVAPAYREAFKAMTEDVFRGKAGMLEFEAIGLRGRHIWLETHAVPLRDDKDEIVALLGITRDVTEHKTAVQALLASEEKFRAITATAADAIILIDDKGRIIYWNPSAERTFGYSTDEAIGRALHLLLAPERYSEAFSRGFSHFVKTGMGPVVGKTVELMATKKDGTEFPMEISVSALKLEGRWHAIGIIRDITERKSAENQIGRSLAEKEVLLKEIHHRVKNNLQVVSSLLMLQARHIKDSTIRTIFDESRNRIHSMSLVHEKLYGTQDLSHIDFAEYVGSLIKNISRVYNRPDLTFLVNMPGIFLDINLGIPCGLIINELVSNCLKHAFPGNRQGTIRIGLEKAPAGQYVLTVADDGTGFPQGLDFRDTASLGLQLVNTLTVQLNGTLELFTEHGTTFRMTFPWSAKNGG